MKIAINGNIIDTELIYLITEVETTIDGWALSQHHFKIKFLNGGELKIRISVNKDSNPKDSASSEYSEYFGITDTIKRNEFIKNSERFNISLNEIVQFRKEIIDIWSEHQSSIPQFNLK